MHKISIWEELIYLMRCSLRKHGIDLFVSMENNEITMMKTFELRILEIDGELEEPLKSDVEEEKLSRDFF
jgi:hypothetical protein